MQLKLILAMQMTPLLRPVVVADTHQFGTMTSVRDSATGCPQARLLGKASIASAYDRYCLPGCDTRTPFLVSKQHTYEEDLSDEHEKYNLQ